MPEFERKQSQTQNSYVVSSAKHARIMPRPTYVENPLLVKQQALGNQAMQRLLQSGMIQAKLKINEPRDKYEQEADRVADMVMRMPDPRTNEKPTASNQIEPAPIQRLYLRRKEEMRRQQIKGQEEKESQEEKKEANFTWCNEKKGELIQKGIDDARELPDIALKALTTLVPKVHENRAIESNFGSISDKQKKTIISRYKHIKSNIDNKEIKCLASCKMKKGPDGCAKAECPGNTIYICPRFGKEGCSNVGNVMLHEAAHNAGACGDIDRDGGYPPTNSQENAYSYEYFVEDLQKGPEEHEPPPRPEREVEIQVPEGPVWRIQRMCSECHEKLERQPIEEEKEDLLAKGLPSKVSDITPDLDARIRSLQGCGQPLPESVRSFFEPRFGHDLSEVRIHTNVHAIEIARAFNARAFTIANNIIFGQGQFIPGTTRSRALIAHELVHVIQQRKVNSNIQYKKFIQKKPQETEEETSLPTTKKCHEWEGFQARAEKEIFKIGPISFLARVITKVCCNYFGFRLKGEGMAKMGLINFSYSARSDLRGILDVCLREPICKVQGILSGEIKFSGSSKEAFYEDILNQYGIEVPELKTAIFDVVPSVSAIFGIEASLAEKITKKQQLLDVSAFVTLRGSVELHLPLGFKIILSYDVIKCLLWEGTVNLSPSVHVEISKVKSLGECIEDWLKKPKIMKPQVILPFQKSPYEMPVELLKKILQIPKEILDIFPIEAKYDYIPSEWIMLRIK